MKPQEVAALVLMTVEETAEFLRCSPSTVYRRLERGEYDAFSYKDGPRWLVRRDGLVDHLSRQTNGASPRKAAYRAKLEAERKAA